MDNNGLDGREWTECGPLMSIKSIIVHYCPFPSIW